MGALILLLLVSTRQIRAQGVAREQARLNAEIAHVEIPKPKPVSLKKVVDPEREERRKKSLHQEAAINSQTKQREKLQRELELERDRLTQAKQEFEALQSQLDQVREEVDAEQSARVTVRRQKMELSEEERKLLDDLEHARRKLMDLKVRQQNAHGEFALVPFDGQSGTTRRPIFVECTERGFRILPEDILLTPEDMNGFSERVNPLLAGMEALTAYWSGRGDLRPAEIDPQKPPYVLLIVRPSGTVAYYLARRFLSRMKEPFGYELVEEDYPLHVPTADPQAKRVAIHAIELSLAARSEILQELASRRDGNQEVVDVKTFNNDAHAQEELTKVEEMLPNRDGRVIAPPMRGGNGGGQRTGRGSFGAGSFEEMSQGNPQRGIAQNGIGQRGISPKRSGPGGSDLQGGSLEGGVSDNGATQRPLAGNSTETNPNGGTGRYATFADLQPTESGETNGRRESVANGESTASGGESGQAGSYSQQLASDLQQQEMQRGTQLQESMQGTGAYREVSRTRTKSATDSQGASDTDGGSDSPIGSGSAGSSANPGSSEQNQQGGDVQVVPDRAAKDHSPVRMKAVPAGAVPKTIAPRSRWGGNSGAGIGMQKKIIVDVEEDKLLIENQLEVPILEGESREMLARRLLGAIDWAASQWGEPHKNYYWIPVVRFRVHPGCLPHQARMQGVLQDWGISSTVEFLKPNQVTK